MSVRDSLVAELRRIVGPDRKVHIVPAQDSVDVIDRRTIILKQQTIQRLEEAPNANLRIDFVVTFIAPGQDITKAEAELDVWVPDVLDDLKRLSWLGWTIARKVLFDPLNWAYDVDVYVFTEPTNASTNVLTEPRRPTPTKSKEPTKEREAV